MQLQYRFAQKQFQFIFSYKKLTYSQRYDNVNVNGFNFYHEVRKMTGSKTRPSVHAIVMIRKKYFTFI